METYSRPYSVKEIKSKFDKETADYLLSDPVHSWRAITGIELIHKEPSKEELERIWKNWQLMTPTQKFLSDKKSISLFGKTNEENYNELIKMYD